MSEPKKPEDAPGHYGAGYGEQVPEGAAPRPAPLSDADEPLVPDVTPPESLLAAETVVITETVVVVETPVGLEALVEVEAPIGAEAPAEDAPPGAGEEGAPVVFTPEDVSVPPPDRTPTEEAPESEKAGLIFERS